MNFDEYQGKAAETAIYPDFEYPRLALAEEVGEFLGVIAKAKRDRAGNLMDETTITSLKKEGGDILWQLAMCLSDLDISMQEVAEMNLKKLADRASRNALSGSGNDR